jgi:hypothetical protein
VHDDEIVASDAGHQVVGVVGHDEGIAATRAAGAVEAGSITAKSTLIFRSLG